jgi:hypothetical protein
LSQLAAYFFAVRWGFEQFIRIGEDCGFAPAYDQVGHSWGLNYFNFG